MDWKPIIDALIAAGTGALVIVVSYAGKILVAWLNKAFAKWLDNWYVEQALEDVAAAVAFVSKTYVDILKSSGSFVEANWSEAMDKCVNAAIANMSGAAMKYIEQSRGGLESWITRQAESILKALEF